MQYDYVVTNIQIIDSMLTKSLTVVDKIILLDNFDYFINQSTYDNEIILDLDLNLDAIEIYCNFMVKNNFKFLQIVQPTRIVSLLIDILEIFDVLICKNQFIMDSFLFELIVTLEDDPTEKVIDFVKTLKNSNKINYNLKETLTYRLSYLFDPEIYYNSQPNDDEIITLVIVPRKRWKYVISEDISRINLAELVCTSWASIYLTRRNRLYSSNDFHKYDINSKYRGADYNNNKLEIPDKIKFCINELQATPDKDYVKDRVISESLTIDDVNYYSFHESHLTIIKLKNYRDIRELEFTITKSTGYSKNLLMNNKNGWTDFVTVDGKLVIPCDIFSENDLHVLTLKVKIK